MKKFVFLLKLLVLAGPILAQVKNGETITDLKFVSILNAPVKSTTIQSLKGKIVLIDFWATWCGACIEGMPHFQNLQKRFPKQLQVITVTSETEKRAAQFLKSRPSNLWFAIDTARHLNTLFPHQLIPHTVLIGPDGKLLANTRGEQITAAVIDSVLRGRVVHLPEKKDMIYGYEEMLAKTFHADKNVKERLLIQPSIKGVGGMSTNYLTDSIFFGRRISAINLTAQALYRLAYGSWPFSRLVSELPKIKNEPAYCLDIIVQNPALLLPTLQQELKKRFEVQAKIESQTKDVYVLKVIDAEKFKKIPLNTSGKRTYYARHGEIDQQAITMTDFASFIEDFGTGRITIDETASKDKFDIKFSFQPEDPTSLKMELANLGLAIEKQQRPVDILVLYKEG